MIAVALALVYPEGSGLEPYEVAFPLWEGYGCHTAAEAHEFVLWLLAGPQLTEVLDHEGEVWEFCRETVRALMVWEPATVSRNPFLGRASGPLRLIPVRRAGQILIGARQAGNHHAAQRGGQPG